LAIYKIQLETHTHAHTHTTSTIQKTIRLHTDYCDCIVIYS